MHLPNTIFRYFRGTLYTFAIIFFSQLELNAAPPTTASSSISTFSIDGGRFRYGFTPGNGERRIVIARKGSPVSAVPVDGTDYNFDNSFGDGDEIAPGEFVVYDGTASNNNGIDNLDFASEYFIKIFDYNGSNAGTEYLTTAFAEGSETTLSAPTVQASGITFSEVDGNSMRLTWTNGNGTSRIVIAKEGAPVDFIPSSLTSYPPNSNFGSNTELGSGNYSVFRGTANTFLISDLNASITYHFAVFEFNGNSEPVYLTPGGTANQITADRPSVPASNFSTFSIDGDRFRWSATPGNGSRRLVIAKKGSEPTALPQDGVDYNASTTFGSGDEIVPSEFVVFDGTTINNVQLSNLDPAATYFLKIFEYDGQGPSTTYLTSSFLVGTGSTFSAPTTPVSGINFTEVTGNSMRINWSNGDGTRRYVIMKEGSPVDFDPVDLTSYSPNSSFGSGIELGTGNYVIANNSNSTVLVSNLSPNTTYHVSIFEANGSIAPVYLRPGITANQATVGAPTINSSDLAFFGIQGNRFRYSFVRGNGSSRIVVAKKGSAVTGNPVDGQAYTANTAFGSGDQLNAGEFVIYKGSGSTGNLFVDDLDPNSIYFLKVFEYNGDVTDTFYLITGALEGNQATLNNPTVQTSNLATSAVTGISITLNWTNGDGAGRVVFAKESSPVDFEPVDLENYSTSSSFGSSTEYGNGNRAVFNNTGSSVTITNLSPNTTYYFSSFEYNGTTGKLYLTPGATFSATTVSAPTTPASAFSFFSIQGNSIRYGFTKGNGEKRIVVAKQGSAVTGSPTDNQVYAASSIFGTGDEIAPGEYVIYNSGGSSGNIGLSDLIPSTDYHFKVFEYNDNATETFYLTSPALEGVQSTLFPPTVQTSNIFISNVLSTRMDLSWTNGNGAGRLLLAKEGSPVDEVPVDLTSYSSNLNFGVGNEIGTGNFVLISTNNTGSTATINSLLPGRTYHFAFFEFNGTTGKVYQTPAYTFSQTTDARPTIQTSALTASNIGADEMRLAWANGDGTNRLLLAKAGSPVDAAPADNVTYNASSVFGSGDEIGTGNFVVFDGADDFMNLTGLNTGTTYHFAWFEFGVDPSSNALYLAPGYTEMVTTAATPVTAPSNLTALDVQANDVQMGWTNGDGEGRLVVFSEAPLSATPVDGVNYNANQNYGAGSALGNGFVVKKGPGTTASVFQLQAGVTYYVNVFEFNGYVLAPAFNPLPLSGTVTTLGAPLVSATDPDIEKISDTSIKITWTNGSGQKRIVLAKENGPVDEAPLDDVVYNANSVFGSGDNLGMSGNFVVYADTGSEVTVTGLDIGGEYHFAIFEYNEIGTLVRYRRINPALISTNDLVLPVELTSFEAEITAQNTVLLNWATATETNNDYFGVQVSRDGVSFEEVIQLSGAGTTSVPQSYSYEYEQAASGLFYFRLRQVDFDGTFAYSSILTVDVQALTKITAYPNPTSDILNISGENLGLINKLTISDMTGKIWVVKVISSDQNNIQLSLSHLPAGVYLLKTENSPTIRIVVAQ